MSMSFSQRFNEIIDFIRGTNEDGGTLNIKTISFHITDRGSEAVIEVINTDLQDGRDRAENQQPTAILIS